MGNSLAGKKMIHIYRLSQGPYKRSCWFEGRPDAHILGYMFGEGTAQQISIVLRFIHGLYPYKIQSCEGFAIGPCLPSGSVPIYEDLV